MTLSPTASKCEVQFHSEEGCQWKTKTKKFTTKGNKDGKLQLHDSDGKVEAIDVGKGCRIVKLWDEDNKDDMLAGTDTLNEDNLEFAWGCHTLTGDLKNDVAGVTLYDLPSS